MGGGREYTYSIRICKLEARTNFLSNFKWPSSQDQQKTIVRRLITSKVTLTDQSHFILIFVLRKATLPNRINSVAWMNAVTPTPYHECTQLVWIKVALRSRQTACIHGTELVWQRSFTVRSYCDRVHSWYGVDVTAVIHGTELMWPWAFMVRSWCDSAKSFHVVPVYTVQWKFIWQIFSFLSFINDEKIHQISYIRTQPCPMTLRSWCNLVKWPYGVKKICIKWLLPVKVTLEVI